MLSSCTSNLLCSNDVMMCNDCWMLSPILFTITFFGQNLKGLCRTFPYIKSKNCLKAQILFSIFQTFLFQVPLVKCIQFDH